MIIFEPQILVKLLFKGSSVSKCFQVFISLQVLWFLETRKLKKTLKNLEKPETKWGLLLMCVNALNFGRRTRFSMCPENLFL